MADNEDYFELDDIPEIDIEDDEDDAKMVNYLSDSLESISSTINDIIATGHITPSHVAAFESLSPGCMLDHNNILAAGGVYSEEAYEVSLEAGFTTEFDLAMYLAGKTFRLISKSALRLASIAKTFVDDKAINSFKQILSTSIHHQETMKDIKWSELSEQQKEKLVNLVRDYSGIHTVGEKETLELLNVVKHSKTSLEVMSKFYLPKHSNILIPLFYIPGSDYKAIVDFFVFNDQTLIPKVDTNLNLAIGELNMIMEKRDWVAMSRFDKAIYGSEEKTSVWKLAKAVRVVANPEIKFAKNLGKIYGATTLLLDHDKKGKMTAPKFSQDLSHYLLDLDKIKNSVISMSDTMMDMSRKGETKAAKLEKDLIKFRASKTLKETFQSGKVANKYSNANYARLKHELKDLSLYCSFIVKEGEAFLKAYMSVNNRVNKLNNETTKFVIHVNKIVGAANA